MKRSFLLLLLLILISCKSVDYPVVDIRESVPVVILPGYGGFTEVLRPLQAKLQKEYTLPGHGSVYMFDYRESNSVLPWIRTNSSVGMVELADMLHDWLDERDLLGTPLHLIGYSQGSILGIYAPARYLDHENPIIVDRYVSIAGPLHGVFFDHEYPFLKAGDPLTDLYRYGEFMTSQFNPENNENMRLWLDARRPDQQLQIWSRFDVVSQRWSINRFQEQMQYYEVQMKGPVYRMAYAEYDPDTEVKYLRYLFRNVHLDIPTKPDAIEKTLEFLLQ
jgi:pimeloyl-ACP methyl ester carboxylesterase